MRFVYESESPLTVEVIRYPVRQTLDGEGRRSGLLLIVDCVLILIDPDPDFDVPPRDQGRLFGRFVNLLSFYVYRIQRSR